MKAPPLLILMLFVLAFSNCIHTPAEYRESDDPICIEPDYDSVVVPPNIAPLNFTIRTDADRYRVIFRSGEKDFCISSRNGMIKIPARKWKALTSTTSDSYSMEFYLHNNNEWNRYPGIQNYIADENIDPYLTYRKLDPVFAMWNELSIKQRDLRSFKEKTILESGKLEGNCINCHSYCKNNADKGIIHIRGSLGGSILINEGIARKVNLKADFMENGATYPAWHPGGDFIAFSSNNVDNAIYSANSLRKIEVFDQDADLVVWDIEKNEVFTHDSVFNTMFLESYPCWDAAGEYLYYCRVRDYTGGMTYMYDSSLFEHIDQDIRYDLMRIKCDPEKREWGDPEYVIRASEAGKSILFPRISPDGSYMIVCMTDFGSFPAWHPESDLYILDLNTFEHQALKLNSRQSESWHSWSSEGRWIVFSSRAWDGVHTAPWIAYINEDASCSKPMILPQKHPDHYNRHIRIYNLPELTRSPFSTTVRQVYSVARELNAPVVDGSEF